VKFNDKKAIAGKRFSCSKLKTYIIADIFGGNFFVSLGKCHENQNDNKKNRSINNP